MHTPAKLILAALAALCYLTGCSSTELNSFGKTVVALGEKAATDALNNWIEENSK